MAIISFFNNVWDTSPKEYDLDRWLRETINPPEHLEAEVELYRQTFDKKVKEKLPCVTISASFSNVRNLDNIAVKNNFIVIDIDRTAKGKNAKTKKCNICVDMQLAKEMFMQHPCTYYTGFSVSNDGVYAILALESADELDSYFKDFQEKFARIGINIDESCKDYTRLRFFSVDKDAYYNPDALYYQKPKKEVVEFKAPAVQKPTVDYNNPNFPERFSGNLNNRQKVELLTTAITYHKIDITSNYNDWCKIAGALYQEFGEGGRDFFHAISQHHSSYTFKDCETKFTQCKNMTKVNLSSVFWIATQYGIRY